MGRCFAPHRFIMQEAIVHLRRADPVMGSIIDRVGDYRIRYREPDYETLVKSIVFQQLSGKVAAVIFDRLATAARGPLTPERILKMRPSRMRTLGLSVRKIEYIRDLARHARSGSVTFDELPQLDDETVIERLTEVRGIGVWTVQMFLMFALRRADVLPIGDLGIRAAVRKAYGLAEMPTPSELEAMGARWKPYRTVASWYLWRSLEPDANL
jgi:DNA-3-methyladenine glycosylase II